MSSSSRTRAAPGRSEWTGPRVLPVWFRVLSATAEPEEYAERITALLSCHYSYGCDKMLAIRSPNSNDAPTEGPRRGRRRVAPQLEQATKPPNMPKSSTGSESAEGGCPAFEKLLIEDQDLSALR